MARTGHTSQKELRDAIERMNKHPEAKQRAEDNKNWRDFLRDIIGIRPASLNSSKGQDFWESVRSGIEARNKPVVQTPTENRGNFYINPKTHHISYRDRQGRFTSYASVGLAKPTYYVSPHARERIYTNPSTHQVSYRNAQGKFTRKS